MLGIIFLFKCPNFSFVTSFSARIFPIEFIFPSTHCSFPILEKARQPMSITEPLSCFTGDMVLFLAFVSFFSSLGILLMHKLQKFQFYISTTEQNYKSSSTCLYSCKTKWNIYCLFVLTLFFMQGAYLFTEIFEQFVDLAIFLT